jgi:hypothetical protein
LHLLSSPLKDCLLFKNY